jgi:hypothetical protein
MVSQAQPGAFGMRGIALAALAALSLLDVPMTAHATAATCAEQPVAVRGEPSRFEILAKAKARGNWRAKVRAMPALGAAFANWGKALAADYRCTEQAGLYVCIASAYPCRD